MQASVDTAFAMMDGALETAFGSDALTSVILVKSFKAGEPLVIAEPVTQLTPRAANHLCLVKLNVGPGNPGPPGTPSTSPGIGIEIWLPTPDHWNERIHNIGGLGGYDGGTHGSPTQVCWPYAAIHADNEGAVSASTDSGHSATNGAWGMNPDGTFATQLWIDYAHRAQHEMAVKTKALTSAFYGRAPKYSYYEGASTGGRHGYRLAQQYPEDYDGIAAYMPALNFAELATAWVYRGLVIERDLGGVALTEGQMDLVSNAAIHACDVVGGQHLGYIMNNEACRYDPTQDRDVLCVADGGTNTSADAVTKAQAHAINKIWYGMTADGSVPSPAIDNGVDAVLQGKRRWYGLPRGTSLYGVYFARLGYPMSAHDGYVAGQVALQLQNPALAEPTFKNGSGDGQGLWKNLSYEQLAHAFDRGLALDADFGRLANDDPDLSAFKSRGGKLLSWHGWNDEAIPVQGTIQYCDRVIQKMGGIANMHSFFKLYLVPGGGHISPHGTSNPDANPPAVAPGQFFKLLVDWVERGIEPDRVVIESPTATPIKRAQPICPYPQQVRYVAGDPNVASSYTCS
jgi:hypothetical protein